MKQQWRIVHQTKSSSLKRLWVYDGIWRPTDRCMWDGRAMPIIGGGAPDTVDKVVGASGDDGTRFTGTTGFVTDWNVIWMGYDPDATYLHQHSFFLWTEMEIPIGSTMTVSYTKLYTSQAGNGTPELKVYGVKEAEPIAPTSAAEFDADPLTDVGVDWDGAWASAQWVQSPSLNPVFQELANNFTILAVMLQIKNDHGVTGSEEDNVVRCWDWDSAWGAQLHIEWQLRTPRSPGYGFDPVIF